MKISCMIVDDEPMAVDLLAEYINQLDYLELKKKCYNGIEALEYLKNNKIDLIFLDIYMPHISGMQLCSLFPADQKFIFSTAHAEFAAESYDRNAIDYLLKPITQQRFLKAVNKALQTLHTPLTELTSKSGDDVIYIKTGKAMVKLKYAEIVVIEGLKDYVVFHVMGNKYIVHKRMKTLEETLPGAFSRVHNSYFINRAHIQKIVDNYIYLDDFKIPVSEKYRDDFLQHINGKLI